MAMDIVHETEKSISGKYSDGYNVIIRFHWILIAIVFKGDFYSTLSNNIEKSDRTTTYYNGIVDELGNTKSNRIQDNIAKDDKEDK